MGSGEENLGCHGSFPICQQPQKVSTFLGSFPLTLDGRWSLIPGTRRRGMVLIATLGAILITISIPTSVHAVNRLWRVVPGRGNGFRFTECNGNFICMKS